MAASAPGPLVESDRNLTFDAQMQEASERPCKADIIEIPDDEGESATSAANSNECFSLYTKGLVVEAKLGAIGVAIFDSSDTVVLETSKPLDLPEAEMREEVAELEAFVKGLEFALGLEIKNVKCGCLDSNLYSYLREKEKPKDTKDTELVKRALDLMKRFMVCHLSQHKSTNDRHVLQLATTSIEKQTGKVNCPICLEDINSEKMYEICRRHHYRHHYCASCVQKHIKSKVRGRELPRCPQPDCRRKLTYAVCKNFLAPKMHDMFEQLFKEASIRASDRLYCPNPRCSNLMSKTEALANRMSKEAELSACTRCVRCRSLFCVNCRVMWHSDVSCGEYKKRESDYLDAADVELKKVAGEKKWRQCPSCSHMVELAGGCNHISCRCGHEFCYMCGSEWKNKEPTCSCRLWSVENIIYPRQALR